MSPTLQKLIDIQPPPRRPVGVAGWEEWPGVEANLGFKLPIDYKEYIMLYGAGRWADFFGIQSPFYRWPHPQAVGYYEWISTRLDGLDEMHVKFPEFSPPFYSYPAPGGLIPIGYTDNGGTICWQAVASSDSWGVVCFADKFSLGYDKFETTLTGFLVGLLERTLSPKTFPPDFFPIPKPSFNPYGD
jgi:hypothetical protein